MENFLTFVLYFFILKLKRTNSFNDEQPQNMQLISVTFLLLKFERFVIPKDAHPKNIGAISLSHHIHVFNIISIEKLKINFLILFF